MKIRWFTDIVKLKDTGIFAGWIVGIFLFGGLLWHYTQDIQARGMIRSVNMVLEARDDPRRLEDPLLPWLTREQGSRFSLVDGEGRAVVFSIIAEGILVPFAAMVSPEGKVEDLVPLTGSSLRMAERLAPEIFTLHIRRIEAAEVLITSGKEK